MKIKKILVPIDFSDCAVNALRFARKMAVQTDAELVMMTVSHMPYVHAEAMGSGAIVQPVMEDYQEEIDEKYEDLIAAENLTEVKYKIITLISGFIDAINQCLREEDIDMIITGTHAEHDFFDTLFGSKSSDIISNVEVPVLMIPEISLLDRVKTIGVAINFSEENDFSKLEVVKFFAQVFNARLVILHIADQSKKLFIYDDEKVKLSNYLKDVDHNFFTVKNKENLTQVLLTTSVELNLDMLFMHPKKYGVVSGLFHKSKTKSMAMNIDIPLLTIKE